MAVYKEYGHKEKTQLMQEATVNGVVYLIDKDGKAYEKKEDLPLVTDKKILEDIKKVTL